MRWLDQPMYAIDCESTSLDPSEARIIQITIGLSQRPGDWKPWTRVINPGVPIPPDSTAVHGYTNERVQAEGGDPREILTLAHEHLTAAARHGRPIVGHNIGGYDLNLISAEFRRHGIGELPDELLVLDLLVLHRRLNRLTGSRRLEVLAAQNGITFPAHDAEQDALATLRLLHILGGENELLPLVSVHDLQPLQARWYAEQQEQAQAKALGNGIEFTPAHGWPVVS